MQKEYDTQWVKYFDLSENEIARCCEAASISHRGREVEGGTSYVRLDLTQLDSTRLDLHVMTMTVTMMMLMMIMMMKRMMQWWNSTHVRPSANQKGCGECVEKEQKRRQRQQHHSSIRCHSFIFLHQPAVLCCISSSVDGVVHIIFNLTHFTKSFVCERNNFIKNTHTHTHHPVGRMCISVCSLSVFMCSFVWARYLFVLLLLQRVFCFCSHSHLISCVPSSSFSSSASTPIFALLLLLLFLLLLLLHFPPFFFCCFK